MNRGRNFLLATIFFAGFILLAGCGSSSDSKTYRGEGNLIVTIFSPLDSKLYNTNPNLSYEVTEGNDNTPVEESRLAASLHGVDDKGNDNGTSAEVTNLYSGVVLPDTPDGAHRLEFVVDDANGNHMLTVNTYYSTDTTSAPIENVEINDQTPDGTTDGTIVTTDASPVLDYTIQEDCFDTNTCEEMVFIAEIDPVTEEIINREPITTRNGDSIETQDDGTYVIEIIYTDDAGNPSSTTITYTIDSTPPAVSISLPSGDVIENTSGSVSYTTFESGTATTSLDGVEIDSRNVTANVEESVSFDGLSLGSHEIVIVTVDDLGNSSADLLDQSGHTITFTTVDLGTPSVTIQEPSDLYDTTTVPLGFTYADDMTSLDNLRVEVILEVWDPTSGLGGEWILANSHIVDIPGGTLTVEGDGAYLLTVQVTDQSDNTGTASTQFSVDTTPPIVEISSPADGSTVATNAPVLEVYSTESSENGVATFVFQGAYVDTFDRVASSVGIGSGHALKQSNGDSLSDGLWTVVVEITDDAGNMGWNYSTFTVDAIPPQVDVLNPVEGANYPNGNVNLKISASGFTSVLIYISLNGAAYPATPDLNIALNDSGWSNGVNDKKELQNLTEGEYSLKAVAVNEGGIVTESNPVEVNFTVFANAPGLKINAPNSDNQYFQVGEVVPFDLNASNYTSIVVKIDGLEVTGTGGGIPSDLGSYGTDKVGVHTVTVTASNGAGEGTASASFYIDGVNPVVNILNPLDGSIYSAGSSVQLGYTITDDNKVDESSVTVSLTSPDGSVSEVSTRNGDSFSSLDSGAYSIEVTANDLAGNGSDPAVVNFTVLDPSPPPPEDDDDDDDDSKKGKSSCHTGPIKGNQANLLELVLCTSNVNSSH